MDLKRVISAVKLGLRRRGPQILIYGGLASMVGGTVAACVETRKAEKIFEDHKQRVKDKKSVKEYAKTGVKLLGVYWPSVAMIGTGVAGVVGGERIQHGRYLGAVSIAAALKAGNDELRKRIEENYGEKAADDLYNGTMLSEDKDGKTVENVLCREPISPYAKIFAYGEAEAAEPNYDYCLMYAKMKQDAVNTLFNARRGFISLNEVYQEFGFPKTKIGQSAGWVWDGKMKIDLGIRTVKRYSPDIEDFEEVVMLVPNAIPNALEYAVKLGKVED